MATRRNTPTIDLNALTALAGLMGIAPQSAPAKKEREKVTERTAAVLSVHEIGLLIQAVESGESTDYSPDLNDPGHRESKVVVLDDVNAAKFRGRYQVVRSITPRTAPKPTPEQEELARLRAEVAALKAQTESAPEAQEGVDPNIAGGGMFTAAEDGA